MLQRRDYDLCLFDVNLPDLSGYALCSWYKEMCRTEERPAAYIVAVTADPDEVACQQFGIDQCLAKPLSTNTIVSLLRQHWQTRSAAAGWAQRATDTEEAPVRDPAPQPVRRPPPPSGPPPLPPQAPSRGQTPSLDSGIAPPAARARPHAVDDTSQLPSLQLPPHLCDSEDQATAPTSSAAAAPSFRSPLPPHLTGLCMDNVPSMPSAHLPARAPAQGDAPGAAPAAAPAAALAAAPETAPGAAQGAAQPPADVS